MRAPRTGKASTAVRLGSFPRIACGCALLFLGLVVVWLRGASREMEYALDSGVREAKDCFNAMLGLVLHFRVDEIVQQCDLTGYETSEALQTIVANWGVDEINIFGPDGRLTASSSKTVMAAVADVDVRQYPQTKPYYELFKRPNGFVNESFRASTEDPEIWMKYVGVYMPKVNKVLQLGYSVERFTSQSEQYFKPIYLASSFATVGCFVGLAERGGGIRYAHQDHPELLGKRVEDLCATGGCPEWLMFLSPLFGQRYRCRPLNLLGRNLKMGFAVLPVGYSYHYAYFYISLFAVALGLFSLAGLVSDRRLLRERRKAEELRENELATAHAIQMSDLQSVPLNTSGYAVSALMEPAREVGGDFYDYYALEDGRLVVTVADVSDKGVPAAIFMMKSRLTLRGLIGSSESLAAAVAAANERLRENNAGKMFVSAFVGVFDPASGRFTYVSAGHNPPILRRADGTLEWMRGRRSLVLALRSGISYHEQSLTLAPGDRLLLYTDGVTEALNEKGELFAEPRLEASVRRTVNLMTDVRGAIADFVGTTERSDDLTLLELVVKGSCTGVYPRTLEGLQSAAEYMEAELLRRTCPASDVSRFLIAFDEIAGNVVRYSVAPEFFVAVSAQPGSIAVRISDAGRAFDPVAQVDPNVLDRTRDRKSGGLGIFMTKRLMDSVEYRRILGRNVTTLIARASQAEEFHT